jgi:hypothetical protein
VSMRKCMLYHSASRRTRRSNDRYLHVSTRLVAIICRRLASAIRVCVERAGPFGRIYDLSSPASR